MNDFEAIFFDFDGVLLDTEPVHWACWAEVLRPFGIELTWEYYRDEAIGIDDRDMLRVLAANATRPVEWDDLWALYPAKKRLFQERMKQPHFEAELRALLPELEGQYRLAVVSSSACVEIEPLLMAGGIRGHFGTIVRYDFVADHSPGPEACGPEPGPLPPHSGFHSDRGPHGGAFWRVQTASSWRRCDRTPAP